VVDAVRCSVEVQRGMADRNAETPEDKRITFRIGVNLGDVIVEEHDIFGDGVNVAARLEGLAEPGGICISRVVRDQIRDKLPYPFEDRGEQSVKNIVRSVQVYALRPEVVAELPMSGAPITVPRRRSVEAKTLLAATLAGRVLAGMTNSRAADVSRAKGLVERALATSPSSTLAHFAKGGLLRTEGRCDEAIPEFEMVITSNRNSPGAFFQLAVCKLLTGAIDETIPLEEQSIRLGPRDPDIFNRYLVIGQVHLLQSRTEEAVLWLEKARSANSASAYPHAWLASAYALKGEIDRADAELTEARRLSSDDRFSSIARLNAVARYRGVPKIHGLYEATYFAGLRKAGMPEE
jgi:tetratricopeptide (TPR) repeat protein